MGTETIEATSELQLCVDGYTCPDSYVNDFTPMEFEDLVAMFKEFDKDGSGAVDIEELFVMMKHMDLEHSLDKAKEFMEEIDADGSGCLEFSEFVGLIVMVKRGDTTLRGFAKLTQELNSTPAAVLAMEASKRGLRFRYEFVERREATSMHDEYMVMEVILTGHWFEVVDGELRESYGSRTFQGIGKTTREARYRAAETALTKMRETMPGLKYDAGVVPDDWRVWVWENVEAGASLESILKTLRLKGFQPWRNVEFMQRILLLDSYAVFAGVSDNASRETYKNVADTLRREVPPNPRRPPAVMDNIVRFEGDDPYNRKKQWNKVAPRLRAWIDARLRDGYDGALVVDTLSRRSHPLDSLPHVAQSTRRNIGGRAVDVARPELFDFRIVCIRDLAHEATLYFHAGQDPDHWFRHLASPRTPLQIAAEHGSELVTKLLLEYHAQIELTDRLNRTALHFAAAEGNAQICRILIDAGADVHAVDNCFDTPLHFASRNNHAKAADVLASYEEQFVREVVSGTRKVGKVDIAYIFNDCYAFFIARNLKDTEARHFKKKWIFDVATFCYSEKIEVEHRKFLTKPVWTAVESVIRILDPDPEAGFVAKTHIEDEVIESWIPTVSKPAHLVELLKYCFQYSALQTPNHLGRTALHEACDANKADSHEKTIAVLLERHVSNLHAVDDHGKTPRELVLQPRLRPDSPTGQPLREDIIEDRRGDLLHDYNSTLETIEAAKSYLRKADALADATRRGTDLSIEHWQLLKSMSFFKRSFAGIDEYEDMDTKNRFYHWQVHDDEETTATSTGGGEHLKDADDILAAQNAALRFAWAPPEEFLFEEKVAQALEHVRRSCRHVRTIGEWEVLRDTRHKDECLLYTSDAIASSGGISISTCRPDALCWPKLHATAVSIGSLGANDEWAMYQVQDRVIFYYKEATHDYRWNRPVDAVEKTETGMQCTCMTFNYKKTEQVWYTCEECNECLPDASTRLVICIHCAKSCHAGHFGVKYVRKSAVVCACHRLSARCLMVATTDESDRQVFAALEEREARRRERLAEKPVVLAHLPDHVEPDPPPEALTGWMLCRRSAGTEFVDGWQLLVDPTQYEYVDAGSVVLVDSLEVIGSKVEARVKAVEERDNGECVYTVVCPEEPEPRTEMYRRDLIVVEQRVFFWSNELSYASWAVPDDVSNDVRGRLELQLEQRTLKNSCRRRLPQLPNSDGENGAEPQPALLVAVAAAVAAQEDDVLGGQLPQEEEIAEAGARQIADTVELSTVGEGRAGEEITDPLRDFDAAFRPHYSDQGAQNIRWPHLTGTEWEVLVAKHSRFLRYLEDWEEYEHVRTQSRFWRDTAVAEKEAGVRRVQRMFRQVFCRAAPRCWYSCAYSWFKPEAVAQLESNRNGWALLRRRATRLRECTDREGREWHEYLDSVCGEMFYYLPASGYSQWNKPDLPDHSKEDKLGVLEEGTIVLFRFPGQFEDTLSIVDRIRIDPDTHERLYDIKAAQKTNNNENDFFFLEDDNNKSKTSGDDNSTVIVKWVRRNRIRCKPLTHEEVERQKEEKLWRMQLRRVKEADEREKVRADTELQNSLFSNARRTATRMNRAEDTARARSTRAAAEAAVLEAEANAAIENARSMAVMANAEEDGIDMKALKAQQAGVSLLRVQVDEGQLANLASELENTKKRMQIQRKSREQRIVQRDVDDQKRLEWLATQEDKATTPRSRLRRRILRLIYKATQRQNAGYVICEWGCGEWVMIGREKLFHEKESCVKRVLPCALGCGTKKREEQWMATRPDGVTVQQWHEKHECARRLVPCERRCGEWVAFCELQHHLDKLCIKRPFPELHCRLGCGQTFSGGAHEFLQCEAARIEHELEMCEERLVRCHFKRCAANVKAKDRLQHRRLHILRSNIVLYTVPGTYSYRVPPATRQLKVQAWGAGGGSGHLRDKVAGGGGGGAFVEVLLMVVPGEYLQITIGAGGSAGQYGEVLVEDVDDEDDDAIVEEHCGVAVGGEPGGGNGHGGNEVWAAGGGGGYTMIQRFTGSGPECIIVASGGGGGGSRDGVPGGGLNGELPGARVDKRNGRMGTQEYGGKGGDSGEAAVCDFPAEAGYAWQGGAGAQFGGGGGGGLFGGGGGGMSPGIAGGGGGGSCYVDTSEWDFVGGSAGDGAPSTVDQLHPGRNGAVRIMRPGFYRENPEMLQPTN
ncbi:hypothetical protein CTAYLR_005737 [Chrysophaeum taylorii]|uniref:receptor protein-tyrosine kinase n=1 Tax=Chrysophaeum taylorii TaxID=2483200 RepID=A0AAD7UIR8_9STRA|nr:hypothetical protein CTAYLR_005737 [Chrysophaeum taylorii]